MLCHYLTITNAHGSDKMIVDKKFVNKLKDFGLNSYEAKIWVALLSRGISSAGELSDISNVPRSRTYDVLESLERKGFIVMKIGKPIKYIAVPPSEVVERVKRNILDDAQKQADLVEDIKKDVVLQELTTLYTQGVEIVEPSDFSASLRDRTNMYSNLNMMIKGAERSIVIMTTAKGLARKADVLKRTLEKAKARGVDIKIAAPINKDSRKSAELLAGIADIRHVDNMKARFCIVDNKQVTFSLMDDEKANPSYDGAVWVNTEFFADALSKMFDHVWKGEMKSVDLKV
jgi:HTH-type transcriptional regulator, sugar sensing transcriptional regulator